MDGPVPPESAMIPPAQHQSPPDSATHRTSPLCAPPLLSEFTLLHPRLPHMLARDYQLFIHCLALKQWRAMSLVDLAPCGADTYALCGVNPLRPRATVPAQPSHTLPRGSSASSLSVYPSVVASNPLGEAHTSTDGSVTSGAAAAATGDSDGGAFDWLVTVGSEQAVTPVWLTQVFGAVQTAAALRARELTPTNAATSGVEECSAEVESLLLAIVDVRF